MRIAVAAVLIPLAVAIAYAGGWLWTAAGNAGGHRPVRGMARHRGSRRRDARDGAGRRCAGGRRALLCDWPARCRADRAGGRLRCGGGDRAGAAKLGGGGIFYAAAAEIASVLVRLDPVKGFAALMFVLLIVWVTDSGGYLPAAALAGLNLAARQPEKDLGGRRRRICREPRRGVRICRVRSGQRPAAIDASGAFFRSSPSSAISSNPP